MIDRKPYSFSPITTKQQFDEVLAYTVRETTKLAKQLTGTALQLSAVKIFAHYPEEWQFMQQVIKEYGDISTIGRSTSIYVDTSLDIEGSYIEHIGIRVPDPYRLQTGCGDYRVANQKEFTAPFLPHENNYIRPFPDMPETFVELWHPDFDVAGYIILEKKEKTT